ERCPVDEHVVELEAEFEVELEGPVVLDVLHDDRRFRMVHDRVGSHRTDLGDADRWGDGGTLPFFGRVAMADETPRSAPRIDEDARIVDRQLRLDAGISVRGEEILPAREGARHFGGVAPDELVDAAVELRALPWGEIDGSVGRGGIRRIRTA